MRKVSNMEKGILGQNTDLFEKDKELYNRRERPLERDKWAEGIEKELEIAKELSKSLMTGFHFCDIEGKAFYGWRIPIGHFIRIYFGIMTDNISIEISDNGKKKVIYPLAMVQEILLGNYVVIHDLKKITSEQRKYIKEKLLSSELVIVRQEKTKEFDWKIKSTRIYEIKSKTIKKDIVNRILMLMFPDNVKKTTIRDKKVTSAYTTIYSFISDL
jgi:hypothetical protein